MNLGSLASDGHPTPAATTIFLIRIFDTIHEMAFYDNRHWLLCNIRNSFISSDDTGMSEIVMLGEDLANCSTISKSTIYPDMSDSDGDEDETDNIARSYDIHSDIDFSMHRRRSNTALRLEKLQKDKIASSKTKCIHWKNGTTVLSDEEKADMFSKRTTELPSENKELKQKSSERSLLSVLIEQHPAPPEYPYAEYARFDGSVQFGIPTRKISIFLTMMSPPACNYPMTVCVLVKAKVEELIGLICWKYTIENREPKLKDGIHNYALYIAEDDGEVDWDFSCLEPKETVAKFGFNVLALVEKTGSDLGLGAGEVEINVRYPDGGSSKLHMDKENKIQSVLHAVLQKRSDLKLQGFSYHLEKVDSPKMTLEPSSKLSEQDSTDFILIRKSESEACGSPSSSLNMRAVEAPLYQSYRAAIITKVRTKIDIHLGISGDKIEIDPIRPKGGSKLWFNAKPVTIDMDCIAACEPNTVKGKGHSVGIRLIYRVQQTSSSPFKHRDFEMADSASAQEIVQKVNYLLEMRGSSARREFLLNRERKIMERMPNS